MHRTYFEHHEDCEKARGMAGDTPRVFSAFHTNFVKDWSWVSERVEGAVEDEGAVEVEGASASGGC